MNAAPKLDFEQRIELNAILSIALDEEALSVAVSQLIAMRDNETAAKEAAEQRANLNQSIASAKDVIASGLADKLAASEAERDRAVRALERLMSKISSGADIKQVWDEAEAIASPVPVPTLQRINR